MKVSKKSLKKIGHATVGSLVGFNSGLVLGPLATSYGCFDFITEGFNYGVVDGLVHGAAFTLVLLPYFPVLFIISPFYGAGLGAKIGFDAGKNYGCQYSFIDVPSEMFKCLMEFDYKTSHYLKRHEDRNKLNEKHSSRFFKLRPSKKERNKQPDAIQLSASGPR